MKSDICELNGAKGQLKAVLAEVEKCISYNDLDKKSALRLRLLAEELVGMLPEILEHAEGTFWMENKNKDFELHVSVEARYTDTEKREKILSISKSGKNAAHAGIMGKIRAAVEYMLYTPEELTMVPCYYDFGMGFTSTLNYTWSLNHYKDEVAANKENEKKEAWDELEKSIVANIADDITVGIKGQKVDIVVKKKFA